MIPALPPGPAPRPFRVSYSQISQYLQCPAQWWFKSVGKYPEKETKGAALGGVIHRLIEGYLKERPQENPDAPVPQDRPHALVQRAIDQGLLPTPGVDSYLVEHKFKLETPDGTPLIGTVDILELSPTSIRVTDHKSAKTERFVKTEEELAVDLQTSIYLMAAKAMAETSQFVTEAITPTVRHIIYMTEGPLKVFEVGPVELSWPEVEKTYLAGVSHVPTMKGLATKRTVDNIPGNRSACENFGGCSYKEICPTYNGARSVFNSTPHVTKPTEEPEPMPMPVIERLPGESQFAFLKRKLAAQAEAQATPEADNRGMNPPVLSRSVATPASTPEGVAWASAIPVEQAATEAQAEVNAALAGTLDPSDTQLPSDITPLPETSRVQTSAPNEANTPKRTRTRKTQEPTPEVTATELKARIEEGLQQLREIQATFTLLVDCIPTKRQYLDMADHLAPAMKAVEEKEGVPFYALMDFAKGPKLVAAYLTSEEGRIRDGELVVVRGTPDWREFVLSILRRDPRCVEIMGIR